MKTSTMLQNKNTTWKKSVFITFSIVFWICAWYVAAILIDNSLLLPTPFQVCKRLLELGSDSEFYTITVASLSRIALGLLWGVIIGIFTASLSALSDFFNVLFSPLVAVTKATPIASFIILVWSFTGGEILPIFISAIIVIPIVHANLVVGFKSISAELRDTAKIFSLPFKTKMRVLYLPMIIPYFVSALTSTLGLAWKAGIAAEVLAYTSNSIGREIYFAKSTLEMTDLFAWTVTVVAISMIFEYAVKQLLKLLPRGYRDASK